MRDALALGVVARLDVGTGEDGDDPVLQVDAGTLDRGPRISRDRQSDW